MNPAPKQSCVSKKKQPAAIKIPAEKAANRKREKTDADREEDRLKHNAQQKKYRDRKNAINLKVNM